MNLFQQQPVFCYLFLHVPLMYCTLSSTMCKCTTCQQCNRFFFRRDRCWTSLSVIVIVIVITRRQQPHHGAMKTQGPSSCNCVIRRMQHVEVSSDGARCDTDVMPFSRTMDPLTHSLREKKSFRISSRVCYSRVEFVTSFSFFSVCDLCTDLDALSSYRAS